MNLDPVLGEETFRNGLSAHGQDEFLEQSTSRSCRSGDAGSFLTSTYSSSAIDEPVRVAMIDEVDIAAERLLPFAIGLGVDDLTLRLVTLTVWTDSVERSAEEKVAEVKRRLMRAAVA